MDIIQLRSNILNQQCYFFCECKKVENLLWMCFRRKSGKVFFLVLSYFRSKKGSCNVRKHLLLWEIYLVIKWTTQSLEKKQSCYFTRISWEFYLNITSRCSWPLGTWVTYNALTLQSSLNCTFLELTFRLRQHRVD